MFLFTLNKLVPLELIIQNIGCDFSERKKRRHTDTCLIGWLRFTGGVV